MTTLNPSHNPFSHDKSRTGQAIHQTDFSPNPDSDAENDEVDSQGYPKRLAKLDREARREARQRVPRAAGPPIPDLR